MSVEEKHPIESFCKGIETFADGLGFAELAWLERSFASIMHQRKSMMFYIAVTYLRQIKHNLPGQLGPASNIDFLVYDIPGDRGGSVWAWRNGLVEVQTGVECDQTIVEELKRIAADFFEIGKIPQFKWNK